MNVDVRDTGPGIAKEDVDRIFVAFFQVDGGPDRRAGGIGLGLSIVKDLVAALSGEISVETTPGAGSAFHVTVPVTLVPPTGRGALAETEAGPPSPMLTSVMKAPSAEAAEFPNNRLLLVDDNDLNAMLAARLLKTLGFDVIMPRTAQ